MSLSLVMTVIGPDRPGLVESLSSTIERHNGSWLESRMANLAGFFAGIVRIECPTEQSAGLLKALKALDGLSIHAIEEAPVESTEQRTLYFDDIGNDRPGIIRQLAAAVAGAGGNVEELNTDLESAPMSGHPVFHATGILCFPPDINPDDIVTALENLSPDLSVSLGADGE